MQTQASEISDKSWCDEVMAKTNEKKEDIGTDVATNSSKFETSVARPSVVASEVMDSDCSKNVEPPCLAEDDAESRKHLAKVCKVTTNADVSAVEP